MPAPHNLELPAVTGLTKAFISAVLTLVSNTPGSDKRSLRRDLQPHGWSVDSTTVNRALYALETSGHLTNSNETPPRWTAVGAPAKTGTTAKQGRRSASKKAPFTPPPLRQWQSAALKAWAKADHCGVVQAVTGTGKTRVGLEAAKAELDSGGRVLILVPTRALLQQWDRELTAWFDRLTVGRLGDGHRDTFRTHSLLVATPHSARNGTHFRAPGLIIADECHRYGSTTWGEALDERFVKRLGLTATYERQDDGDDHLASYLGSVPIFDIDYKRAIAEEVVSPFRLAFIGVDLGSDEMEAYLEHSDACGRAFGRLVNECGLPAKPFGKFMIEVARAADGAYDGRAQRAAWTYQASFAKKRAVLADTHVKLERLRDLNAAVADAQGTLVFTQTKQAAQQAAKLLTGQGHRCAAIWGGLAGDEREQLLEAFRQGKKTVLTAPRVLDEGIDVPAADLGIVISASNGRRQMIQRMGRVLRRKKDGRRARLVVLYATGTSEDPATGAHEGFISLAADVAEATKTFTASDSAAMICRFLKTGR